MRKLFLAALLAVFSTGAFAQSGAQIGAGQVWGNSTAARTVGKSETVTAILDRALGSTRGALIERGASGWGLVGPGATAGLPFVSAGAGADPVYQRLGLLGGGTNADLSATGGASQFLRQNSAGAAITVVQPAFTDISGRNTLAQLPQGIANSIFINPTGSTANMQNLAIPACANDGLHALVYVNASGLVCSTILAGAVSSIAGNIGAFTLSNGVTNATNDIRADPTFFQNYLTGCGVANNATDAVNDIDISPCVVTDSLNTTWIKLASAITKRTDAAWSVGTGNGCWDTGSVANGIIYWWVIRRSDTGVADVLCSASGTAPTMPASYDSKRLIAKIPRLSASILAFHQFGNDFWLDVPFQDDTTGSLTTSDLTVALDACPPAVLCRLKFYGVTTAAGTTIWIRSPFMTGAAVTAPTNANFRDMSSGVGNVAELEIQLDGSAQFIARAQAAVTTFTTYVRGWYDTRGQ